MSRTSADAGAGENRQYRGPASEAIDFREQLDHTSETRFRRSASDSILGAAGVFPFFSVWGTCTTQQCRSRESARVGISGVRKGVRPTTGTHKGRAPHRRGAGKQVTRKRKEGK